MSSTIHISVEHNLMSGTVHIGVEHDSTSSTIHIGMNTTKLHASSKPRVPAQRNEKSLRQPLMALNMPNNGLGPVLRAIYTHFIQMSQVHSILTLKTLFHTHTYLSAGAPASTQPPFIQWNRRGATPDAVDILIRYDQNLFQW
jgi:hypothetical protein